MCIGGLATVAYKSPLAPDTHRNELAEIADLIFGEVDVGREKVAADFIQGVQDEGMHRITIGDPQRVRHE